MFCSTQVVFVAFAVASSILAAHTNGLPMSTVGEDCSEYTFSNCHLDYEGVIANMESADPESCQKICAEIFPDECSAFFYSHADSNCILLKQSVGEHVKNCDQIGGTKTPSVEYCLSQTDPCSFFHSESCTNTSDVIAYLPNVESASVCQRACELHSNCPYFLYDINVRLCQLLGGLQRDCAFTVGPARPSVEECRAPKPTTPATTALPPIPSECTTPVYGKSDGHCACGFYLDGKAGWLEARDQCAARGARLPEIYSDEDNDAIVALQPPGQNMWIGGSDLADKGTYAWESSGAPFSYTNWYHLQPDDYNGIEDCAHLYLRGQWNDFPCQTKLTALCEVLFEC